MTTSRRKFRKQIWKFLIPVLGIAVVALIALSLVRGCSESGDHGEDHPEVEVGMTLPDFELQRFGGEKVQVSQVQGKVFLINFWATWCGPCVVEMPSLVKLREAYKDKGFEVLFVSVDEEPEKVLPPFLKRLGIGFPVYVDTSGDLSQLFDVHGIPLTVIIDRERTVLHVEAGERDWNDQDVKKELERWLSE